MPKTPTGPDGDVETTETTQARQAGDYKYRENVAKKIWLGGMEIKDKYTSTWTSPDGMSRQQIDYVVANSKYRDTSRTAQSNIYWHSNMNLNQQRRVHTTQLYYNAEKTRKVPIAAETGAQLKYDIREPRIRPERLTKWHQCREDEALAQQDGDRQRKKETDIQDWTLRQTQLGDAIHRVYPLSKKQTTPSEPELVSRRG